MISKIVVVVLENNIDLSRLEVIELDNSKNVNEFNNMIRIKRFELPPVVD